MVNQVLGLELLGSYMHPFLSHPAVLSTPEGRWGRGTTCHGGGAGGGGHGKGHRTIALSVSFHLFIGLQVTVIMF